jgi:CIC family chloride channel protein
MALFIKASLANIRARLSLRAEGLRDQLAHIDALPQLTLLGLMTGILAGLIIVLFRWVIDIPLGLALPDHGENFEALAGSTRFLLPIVGGLILGLILQRVNKLYHSAGIGHVLDRIQNHQGRMPLGNFINQFAGGALCLLAGQSVGREGPAVHLGAGCGSLLGQWLRLPNNSLRPLAGCGVAAAIAASFNTPMAGVIFAMEVVMMEYTIAGFIPVILAAVAGTTITHLVFGPDITFITPQIVMGNILELPLMAITGLVVAVFAAAFIRLQGLCCKQSLNRPIWLRFLFAGIVTGILALWVPQIMGVGYDTISAAIAGEIGIGLLIAIVIAKLIATGVSLGVGMPGGVVGPCLVMGATVGGAMGVIAHLLMPGSASHVGFYVILGMGAMMGAVLNAPLAAMMAILELTYNPHIIFPGMLVVVAACLTTRWVFRCDGLFQTLLRIQGKYREPLNSESGMIHQMLSRTGIRSIMDKHIVYSAQQIAYAQAESLLQHHPHWILLEDNRVLLHPADLLAYLEQNPAKGDNDREQNLDLMEIPARRLQTTAISLEANLYEALQAMNNSQVDAVCVTTNKDSTITNKYADRIKGIVTREKLENYYRL